MAPTNPFSKEYSAYTTTQKPRRRKWIIIGSIAAVIIIALALGLGVGLTRNKNNESEIPSTNGTTTPTNGTWWKPSKGLTWQIILNNSSSSSLRSGTFDPVAVYDIDLFDTPASTISRLHSSGKRVICYFSAGSYEDWRPDASQFPSSSLGNKLDNWPGEKWIDTNSAAVRAIMKNRLDLAVQKNCDAVDPDNIDAYENDNGLGLTTRDAIDYVSFLAKESHSRGLACGLKNGGKIVPNVLSMVEFEVNEQCVQYNECNTYSGFITAGKPVFHIEYLNDTNSASAGIKSFCNAGGEEGFSTVIKNMGLDEFYEPC